MKDIGPNRHLNRKLAIAVAVVSALPLFIALQPLTFLPIDQWTWAIIPGSIGLAILAVALWILSRPPLAEASIRFRPDGFTLDIDPVLRQPRTYQLAWSDIREVHHVAGGYGARYVEFHLSHDAAVREGLVQPTTRHSAPYRLVRRRIAISTNHLEHSGHVVIERLAEAAGRAGFTMMKTAFRLGVLLRTKWTVSPTDGAD